MDLYYRIAEVCHEANRAYCKAIGDDSQLPWTEAPDWQKNSAENGVRFKAEFPLSTPADSHKSWLVEKQNTGWTHGPVKDPEKKEHPCMVEYDQLPAEQRAKDYIFQAIAETLLRQSHYWVTHVEIKDEDIRSINGLGRIVEFVHDDGQG